MKRRVSLLLIIVMLITSIPLGSVSFAETGGEDYYSGTDGLTGDNLKAFLNDLIDGHTVRTYSEAYNDLMITDVDPSNSNNVILFYSGESKLATDKISSVADGWNREHTWAKSHGDFGTSNGPGTDLHQLRATDADVNNARNHYDFSELDETAPGVELVDETTDSYVIRFGDEREGLFEPREDVKGDVARILFYMATRYEGEDDDYSSIDLELSNSELSISKTISGAYGEHGVLDVLLQWHIDDPVDSIESARNEAIYGIQGNRNPFIDHPEFVSLIWDGTTTPVEPPVDPPVSGTLTVAEALAAPQGDELITMEGYIVAPWQDNIYAVYVADSADFNVTTDGAGYILVKLETDDRATFSPVNNPDALGKKIIVTGKRDTYSSNPSIEYVTSIEFADVVVEPPVSGTLTLKEALALPSGTADVTVQAQIAYFATSYGNPILQAEVEGQVYSLYVFGAAPDGAKVGDTVKMNGTFTIYNGLPELTSVLTSDIISSDAPMAAQEMTIQEIKDSDLATIVGRFVKIKDVTLGEYMSSGSTTVTDATGSISIYKATSYPALVEQGDVVDLYAMISCYKTSVQLYVGTKEDNGFNIYDIVNDIKNPLLTLNDNYLDAKTNTDYTITVGAADNKGIDTVKVSYVLGETMVSDQLMTYDETLAVYKFVVPASEIVSSLENIEFTFTATDITGLSTTDSTTVTVDNRPQITDVLPSRNSNLANNNTPTISVMLNNAGTDPVVTLSMTNGDASVVTDQVMTSKGVAYEYTTDVLEDGTYTVTVIVVRADGESNQIVWSFTIGTQQYKPYFGQLHAHTAEYSDGSGTLANGLNYLKSIPTNDNVDFISFTDHSNYFDTKDNANPAGAMNDKTMMTAESLLKWNAYNSTTDAFNTENSGALQALTGYEMTWSGGPGHINTFNSVGLVSRNNSTLNNKSDDAGMKAYYETLIQNTDPLANLSQFNHPGNTFGTFSEFAYWSPAYDNKMVAIEVGNGEGAISSGGYFTSYAEYTKALDKGWHVAPTNNQDNHKGKWGNANTSRTVIISDQLTKDGLLTGLKNMSVYTTEDKNLDIKYTVNDQQMGSIIAEVPTQPLQFIVKVNDPDNGDVISKIEIVSNGGRVLNSKTFTTEGADWSFDLPSQQGYYYVRVTQADKNIAVTAPIWIGQAPLVGISSFETATKLPVTDETLDFTTTLFNNETAPVTVKTIEYKLGDEVLKTDILNQEIASSGTMTNGFSYTPTVTEEIMLTVTAIVDVAGQEKSFEQKLVLYVRDASKLTYVGIDASHYNEYVSGNYKDSMGNFASMAVQSDVRVVELKTSEDLIAATQNDQYKMIILTPPTRRNGNAFLIGYKSYTDEEIAAIKMFAEKGNTVIVTGWGDYYESYDKFSDGTPHDLPADQQMSAQQNKLLTALGSNIRISDDEVKDDTNNGGQSQRLYLSEYNLENEFVKNVSADEQVFSNYGGATIYTVDSEDQPSSVIPATVSPMVYSFTTSYSADDDKDGTTGHAGILVPKYNDKYMIAASEKVAYENGKVGTIIVTGAAFMSNFEIQAVLDSYATPEYSNFTIIDDIVKSINTVEITSIADVHEATEGARFVIEGTVTSNASGFDKDTAFFDSIYLQDETAGINAFPVAGDVRAGQIVRIKGTTSSYNGERQINVTSIEILDETINVLPEPIVLTTAQAAAGQDLGSLVKVLGIVTRIEKSNDVVESIFVEDESGEESRVFIDGYITKDKTIANLVVGSNISAVGLSSISTEGPRIRVRDRDDVIVLEDPVPPTIENVHFTDLKNKIITKVKRKKFFFVNAEINSTNLEEGILIINVYDHKKVSRMGMIQKAETNSGIYSIGFDTNDFKKGKYTLEIYYVKDLESMEFLAEPIEMKFDVK